MKFTASEIFFASDFAEKISNGNIDDQDFMDSRNANRSKEKVIEDNVKGKLAEILIYNELDQGGSMDFNIYEKGIGDGCAFDIEIKGFSIDVKASSPRAKYLMVEQSKANSWKKQGIAPDYLCMVSIDGNNGEYMFGIDADMFRKKAKLLIRGENIPGTSMKLKASNYIVHKDDCHDINHLINRG